MSLIIALFLGIIQGLTEFIPISSTAHLTIAATWLDVIDPNHPERWTAFMATIQLGTLAAVLAYFRRDILHMTKAFFAENVGARRRPFKEQSGDARMAWLVVIGTIPIVIVGFAFKEFIEGGFTKNLNVIGTSLIVVALMLWWADRRATFTKTSSQVTVWDSIWIGMSQILALIPGSSRSGTTIFAGLLRGLTREHAARFSFLLSIPAILGSGILQFIGELEHISWAEGGDTLLLATVTSGISGYLAIAFLLRYLRTHSLTAFVVYRIALGAVILFVGCTPETESGKRKTESLEQKAEGGKRKMESVVDSSVAPADVPEVDLVDSIKVTGKVRVSTTKGNFTIVLYGEDAPQTVDNFVGLIRKRYYDGMHVHRVSKDFVVQMGDPTTKDLAARQEWGRGGETASGEPLPEELNPDAPSVMVGYQKGVVAMARKPAAGTGTSQFFICLDSASNLPHQYTIFGRITDGLDVIEKIAAVEVEPGLLGDTDGIPVDPIRIRWIRKR